MAASQALAAAARGRRGHEPWLFYPRDGRWRWWSFERAWTEVERWRAVLERGEGPAADAAPPPESSPEALCHYLAASACEPGRFGESGAALASFDRLLACDARGARGARDKCRCAGLLAGIRRISTREIVVVTPPAEAAAPASADRLARLWLDWCCANLAVLALEPRRRALVGSVLWCRPTAVLLDADQERALHAAVTERSGGRDRRAAGLLDRLRVLLVAADDGDFQAPDSPPPADWRRWGVERRAVGNRDAGR